MKKISTKLILKLLAFKVLKVLAFVYFFSSPTHAQLEVGVLNINKPASLDSVLWRLRKLEGSERVVKGYRILLFQALGRDAERKSMDMKSKFLKSFPELSDQVEVKFSQPRYEVLVGKYLQRIDAYRSFKKLKRKFPNSLIVDAKFKNL